MERVQKKHKQPFIVFATKKQHTCLKGLHRDFLLIFGINIYTLCMEEYKKPTYKLSLTEASAFIGRLLNKLDNHYQREPFKHIRQKDSYL